MDRRGRVEIRNSEKVPHQIGNAGGIVIRRDLLSGESWDVNLEGSRHRFFCI